MCFLVVNHKESHFSFVVEILWVVSRVSTRTFQCVHNCYHCVCLKNLVNHVVAILLYSVILGTFQVRMWEACFPLDDIKY